jgi:type I restriction enzyme S subunit
MKTVALREICTVFGDGDWIESKDQSTDGIRLIQTGNVGDGVFKDRIEKARWISEETFQRLRCTEIGEGDVLISRLPDPVGRSCLLPALEHKAITAVDCSIVRFDQEVMDPKFFVYYSQSSAYASSIEPLISGSTRQRISRENLGTIQIPIPPLKKQREIVERLDSAFAEIELLERNLTQCDEKTNQLNQSLLNTAFTVGISATSRKSFLGDHVIFQNGYAFKSKEYTNEGHYLIRIKNVQQGHIEVNDQCYVSIPKEDKFQKFILHAGDIVVSLTGNVGRIARIRAVHLPAALNQRVASVKPKSDSILTDEYLYYLLRTPEFLEFAIGTSKGAAQQNISTSDMEKFEIHIPTIEEQNQVVEKLDEAFAEIEKIKNQLAIKRDFAGMLRQSLLSDSFSPNEEEVKA